jgi:magnesium chelatase family protein
MRVTEGGCRLLAKVKTCGLNGIDAYLVEVEVDISNGIPAFDIVGLGDTIVKESRERVRSAIRNSELDYPVKRITVNLAPADTKKEGSSFDFPITIGILSASGIIDNRTIDDVVFAGELSLDGRLRPVQGMLPMAVCAKEKGMSRLLVPVENADEAAIVKGIDVIPVKDLREALDYLRGEKALEPHRYDMGEATHMGGQYEENFADVRGQENVKRALEVAASGGHNCIMLGSPGCGKTMLAKRVPGILPPLSFEEAIEVTKIYSIAGLIPPGVPLITTRPFRAPHHTITEAGLVGGGKIPKPGEISLANHGVLFLDELQEFNSAVTELLRQPLEDGTITISRLNATITYPARFMTICAANPCRCGYLMDETRRCSCTPYQIKQYTGRLSGPLLDRMDIHIEMASVKYESLQGNAESECSSVIRERVSRCRKIQYERYHEYGIYTNSQLTPQLMRKFCRLDKKGQSLLKNAFKELKLSARGYDRILKVSRTIGDMEESNEIKEHHIAEAIQYRCLDRMERYGTQEGY